MSVLLPDTVLGVRRAADGAVDALGEPLPGVLGPLVGPWPGRAREGADGRWALAVDPAGWPVRQHDVIEAVDGLVWVVVTAQLIRNTADPAVDWVRVEALQRVVGGTEPGGAMFAGR